MTSFLAWGGAAELGVLIRSRYFAHATGEGDYVRLRESFKPATKPQKESEASVG